MRELGKWEENKLDSEAYKLSRYFLHATRIRKNLVKVDSVNKSKGVLPYGPEPQVTQQGHLLPSLHLSDSIQLLAVGHLGITGGKDLPQ